MSKTSNIFARVEPSVKEQAENVLNQLGIPMSSAIGLFLHQVVLQRGIPFEMKLPQNRALSFGDLSIDEFNSEIEKGFEAAKNGRVASSSEVRAILMQDFGV